MHKEVYNLKVVHSIILGFGGHTVIALILRGFRLLGRFLLHVLRKRVDLASRIARVRRERVVCRLVISGRSRGLGGE